jgi:hypothetical protein
MRLCAGKWGRIMGKRSDFARVERDFYPTPREAVSPLLPHLPYGAMFLEPCAGDGALVRHLEANGMSCQWAGDIEPKAPDIERYDALGPFNVPDFPSADFIITNPPWDRKILHPMIGVFSKTKPTWLLFDADWIHTKQAAPFMPLLRKIVSVGRVKWIPDSKMTGKDNCAWHLFDRTGTGTEFFGTT